MAIQRREEETWRIVREVRQSFVSGLSGPEKLIHKVNFQYSSEAELVLISTFFLSVSKLKSELCLIWTRRFQSSHVPSNSVYSLIGGTKTKNTERRTNCVSFRWASGRPFYII